MGKLSHKLVPGNVYAIPIDRGYGFLQYVGKGMSDIEVARVLAPTAAELGEFTPQMCLQKERYYIRMVVRAAERRGLLKFVGNYPLPPDAALPTQYRHLEYVPHRNIRDWYVVDVATWKYRLVRKPDVDFFKLSCAGIWNIALLRERLEQNWSLEEWK